MKEQQALARSLNYRFSDPTLCRRALTHRSADSRHNERLEFLGDALLGMLVAEHLFCAFPEADEGQLTRIRAALVNRESLAELARSLQLGDHLVLGEGEQKSGGWRRDSILANSVEALLGAIYLDGGFEACRGVVRTLYHERFNALDLNATAKDAKTALQEFLQARQQPLPRYETTRVSGPAHAQLFRVACHIDSLAEPIAACGPTRRKAEQAAARAALDRLTG
ncbi:MAG: ribonuclease III [Gammaproteobacteria bacterium]